MNPPGCQIAEEAPSGSAQTAAVPRPGTSTGSWITVPPAAVTFAAVSAASATEMWVFQNCGSPGVHLRHHPGDVVALVAGAAVAAGVRAARLLELPAEQVAVEGHRGVDVGDAEVDPAGRPRRVARHFAHRCPPRVSPDACRPRVTSGGGWASVARVSSVGAITAKNAPWGSVKHRDPADADVDRAVQQLAAGRLRRLRRRVGVGHVEVDEPVGGGSGGAMSSCRPSRRARARRLSRRCRCPSPASPALRPSSRRPAP